MFVSSLSNLVADGLPWRPRFGGHAFVVIAKATFVLRQGRATLAAAQDPILAADHHYDDDPAQSVYAPSDYAPFKDHVDVTMVGDAVARGKRGSRALVTRLCVGAVDKRIVCFPTRWIDEHGQLRKGDAFHRAPLRYEHALGGPGSDNPVGIDPDDASTATRCLPRLEPFGRRRCEDEIACFAPVAASWPSRRRQLRDSHLRDGTFAPSEWNRHPLPESLEPGYFNVAPPDQRLDELAADAVILLENVHPHLPRLRSQLPGLRPRAFVERSGSAREVFLQADSLWIDTRRGVCTVTWRGSFEVAAPDETGHVLVALEDGEQRLTWPDVAALAAGDDDRPSAVRLVAARAPLETLVVDEDLEEHRAYDRAVGDDADDTVVLRRPSVPAPALPFVAPATPSVRRPTIGAHAPPPASAPAPHRPVPTPPPASQSPWATGAVSAVRHSLRPPATSTEQTVAPPPLMLVPSDDAPDVADVPPASDNGHLDLIGYDDDPDVTDRLRAGWPAALATLDDDEPLDDRVDELPFDERMRRIFAPPSPKEPVELERAIAAVLRHATPHRHVDLEHDARAAVDDDGLYRAPWVVLHGRLRLRFDEVATFNALLEACTVALPDSEALSREVAILRKLQRQGAAVSTEVASELTERLRRVCQQEEGVDDEAIERRARRQLLTERQYQTRRLLGGVHLRGELSLAGEERAVVIYLPEAWRDALPLFAEVDARVIGELHRRQDQWEHASLALACVALGEHVTNPETPLEQEE